MAQRTERKETIALCINNCGVTGNPATNNMCQKCFNTTASSSSCAAAVGVKFYEKVRRFFSPAEVNLGLRGKDGAVTVDVKDDTIAVAKREVNRCFRCRRKVGLTGIRCKCGELLCSDHGDWDRHDCSYDHKKKMIKRRVDAADR